MTSKQTGAGEMATMTIRTTLPMEGTITFQGPDGKQKGMLDLRGDKATFLGDAEESALIFFNCVCSHFNTAIASLKHDIERHMQIAADLANELEAEREHRAKMEKLATPSDYMREQLKATEQRLATVRAETIERVATAIKNIPAVELAQFSGNRWNAVALTKHIADLAIRALNETAAPVLQVTTDENASKTSAPSAAALNDPSQEAK